MHAAEEQRPGQVVNMGRAVGCQHTLAIWASRAGSTDSLVTPTLPADCELDQCRDRDPDQIAWVRSNATVAIIVTSTPMIACLRRVRVKKWIDSHSFMRQAVNHQHARQRCQRDAAISGPSANTLQYQHAGVTKLTMRVMPPL